MPIKMQTESIWWPLFKSRSFSFGWCSFFSHFVLLLVYVTLTNPWESSACTFRACIYAHAGNKFHLHCKHFQCYGKYFHQVQKSATQFTCQNESEFGFRSEKMRYARVSVSSSVFHTFCTLVGWNGIWSWAENLLHFSQQQWINKQHASVIIIRTSQELFQWIPWLIMLVGFNKIQHIHRMKYAWHEPTGVKKKIRRRIKA